MLYDDQPEKYFTFKALNEAASLLTHDPEAAERWRVVRAGARLPRGSDPRVWKNGGAPTPVRPRFAQTYGHNGAVTYLRNEDYTSMGACVPTLWTPWRIFACECCAHLACAHVVACGPRLAQSIDRRLVSVSGCGSTCFCMFHCITVVLFQIYSCRVLILLCVAASKLVDACKYPSLAVVYLRHCTCLGCLAAVRAGVRP